MTESLHLGLTLLAHFPTCIRVMTLTGCYHCESNENSQEKVIHDFAWLLKSLLDHAGVSINAVQLCAKNMPQN